MAEHIEETIITNICLIYDEDKILVQLRNKNTWPGLTLPGGHVEKNESFIESTIREIKEETGLDISNLVLCGVTQWTPMNNARYITLMYKTNCFSGELKSSSEGQVFWIKRNELNQYNLSQDLKEMLMVMENDSLSEFFSLMDEDGQEIQKKLL